MRRILSSSKAPSFSSFPLSQGVETEQFVFTAGMAFDEKKMQRLAEAVTVSDETRICLESIDAVLAEAGCSLKDVVKTTVYLADRSYFAEMNEVYKTYWKPNEYPLRCSLYVGIGADCRVEIDVIAVKPKAATK